MTNLTLLLTLAPIHIIIAIVVLVIAATFLIVNSTEEEKNHQAKLKLIEKNREDQRIIEERAKKIALAKNKLFEEERKRKLKVDKLSTFNQTKESGDLMSSSNPMSPLYENSIYNNMSTRNEVFTDDVDMHSRTPSHVESDTSSGSDRGYSGGNDWGSSSSDSSSSYSSSDSSSSSPD